MEFYQRKERAQQLIYSILQSNAKCGENTKIHHLELQVANNHGLGKRFVHSYLKLLETNERVLVEKDEVKVIVNVV